MIPTAVQLKAAAQHADPPLDAGPKAKAAPPPGSSLLLSPFGRRLPRRGEHNPLNPGLLGQPFIGDRVHAPIAGQEPGRVAEALRVARETSHQIGLVLPGLVQEAIATHDAAIDFI